MARSTAPTTGSPDRATDVRSQAGTL